MLRKCVWQWINRDILVCISVATSEYHYIANRPQRQTWVGFLMLSIHQEIGSSALRPSQARKRPNVLPASYRSSDPSSTSLFRKQLITFEFSHLSSHICLKYGNTQSCAKALSCLNLLPHRPLRVCHGGLLPQ